MKSKNYLNLCYSIKEAMISLRCKLTFPMPIWSNWDKIFSNNGF